MQTSALALNRNSVLFYNYRAKETIAKEPNKSIVFYFWSEWSAKQRSLVEFLDSQLGYLRGQYTNQKLVKEGNGNGTRVEEENNCDKWRASQLSYVLLHNFPMHHIVFFSKLKVTQNPKVNHSPPAPCRAVPSRGE